MTPLLVDVIHLQTWIPSIVQLFQERIHRQRQQLYILMTADLPPLTTEVLAFEQTLVQLLTQVCSSTPAGELITISAHTANSLMQISVSSSGFTVSNPDAPPRRLSYCTPDNTLWQSNRVELDSAELTSIQKLVQQLGGLILIERAASQTTFTLQFPCEAAGCSGIGASTDERILLSSGASTRSIA